MKEVMDINQAARYLGISKDTLYKYAASGFVPGFRLGNRWRFSLSGINKWIEAQEKKP